MKKFYLLTKTLLVATLLMVGASNAWATAVPYTVGTPGSGDAWESRKYSDAYEIAPGETYHFTFTNTSYGSNNWNNWLLDCKASSDTSADDWYFTMRADNYGWGTSYNSAMRYADFVWDDFQTVMNGATVDMYVDYNSTDKIIRTYATITKSETTWHYNFASKAIDQSSVFLFLSEELANLNITTAEKVANIPTETYGIYKRSITDGYGYTWDVPGDITTSADYQNWTVNYGTKSLDLTDGMKWTGTKTSGLLSTTISPAAGNILNIEAEFFLKGATGSSDTRPDEAYFRFGKIYIYEDAQYNKLSYVLDGTTTVSSSGNPIGTVFYTGSNSDVRNTGVAFKLVMEINTATNVLTSMKVYTHGDLVTPKLNISDVVLSEPDYTTIGIGNIRTRSTGEATASLKSISVSETPQSITTVDYTVKFQDALGNTLKEDVVHDNGVVGEVYQATAADMATFYNNADESLATKKYVYSSGQNTSVEASSTAAENVITLVFTVYDKTAYTVNAQAGGSDIKTGIATGSAYLDGSTTAYWSKYLKVDDQWYITDETTYGAAITTATTNVAYTATDAIDYFYEFEDMTISSAYNSTSGDSYSNGSAKTLGASGANAKTTSTIAAGVYTISMYGKKWADKNDNYRVSYSTDGTNWIYLGDISYGNTEEGLKSLSNAIIPAASYIKFETTLGAQTPRRYMDYITFAKTADIPTTENIVVTSAGYATYVSNYNLDFTSSTTKAYKVSVAEKGVATMTEVAKVPAKTPVLLYVVGGNGAGEAIPVTTDAVSAVSGNNLVAGTGAAVATDDGDYTNMILNNVSGIGFYFAAGQTVATNRAYLHIADDMAPAAEATARGMILEFADEKITGINEAAAATEAVVKEGKFFIDGKLVIFQKGMKFNANGARIY